MGALEHIKGKMDKIRIDSGDSLNKSDEVRKFILRNIMRRPVRTVAVVVMGMFLFIFFLLGILRGIDTLFKDIDCAFLDIVRFKGGVESWFAFYGGFMGVIATVVLGIITFRLDIKFNQSEQITEINKLSLREMRLYDFKRDYRPSILIREGDSKRFMLMLLFDKFDLYYEIKIDKVTWACADREKRLEVAAQSICVKGTNQMAICLNFDDVVSEDMEETFNYYYRIGCYESMMMELGRRQRQLELELHLSRTLYSKKEKIAVNLMITLENGGYQDGYMILEEKNYHMRIENVY